MYNKSLSTFICVADCGSFSKASARLFASNVSIMKQINALEDEIGVKLFSRTSHGVSLTEAGRLIYDEAQEMIRQSTQAIARARAIAKTEERHTIRVGSSFLRSAKPLLSLWTSADTANSPIELRIVPFDDDFDDPEVMFHTLSQAIDCFWGPCDLKKWDPLCTSYPFGNTPHRIAVPPQHPLAAKDVLALDDLSGESLVIMRHGIALGPDKIHHFLAQNYPDIHLIESPTLYSPQLFSRWLRMGYLVVTLDMWTDAHPRFVTIPVKWEFSVPYGLVCLSNPSGYMQIFIQTLLNKAAELDVNHKPGL